MQRTFVSHSEEQTMAYAREFAKEVDPGSVIALKGDLGTGKTRFVKGFVEAFGISPEEVTSPSYTLLQEYSGSGGMMLYHFDFYRIESEEEALEIGSEEYFYGDGISLIEWPEKIPAILPESTIDITMAVSGRKSRTIRIKYPTEKAVS